jgi:hypothetical protein
MNVAMVRLLANMAVLAALGACATAPEQPAPVTPPVVAAPEPAPEPPAPTPEMPPPSGPNPIEAAITRLSAADGAPPPTLREVEGLLGRPDITRYDGVGAILTWRLETCGLALVFAADQAGERRLAAVSPARRTGQGAPVTLQTCVAEARARAKLP